MTSPSEAVEIAEITQMLNDEPVEKPEARPRGDKTSEVELEQRIRIVVKWISEGMCYSDIVRGCEGSFDVSRATAERYIAQARERIQQTNAKEREKDIAVAKQRYETFMHHAFVARDYSVSVSANNALVKLLGLAEPDKVEHGASDKLAELVAQIRAGDRKESV